MDTFGNCQRPVFLPVKIRTQLFIEVARRPEVFYYFSEKIHVNDILIKTKQQQ